MLFGRRRGRDKDLWSQVSEGSNGSAEDHRWVSTVHGGLNSPCSTYPSPPWWCFDIFSASIWRAREPLSFPAALRPCTRSFLGGSDGAMPAGWGRGAD